jgi:abhydrolase domain-containing protein 5
VQHLVLVCPAGVPKAPEDWCVAPRLLKASPCAWQTQRRTASAGSDAGRVVRVTRAVRRERKWLGDKWTWRGQLFKVFMRGWEAGVTPGSVIRGLGPLGERIVHGYVSNRFSHHGDGLKGEEAAAFQDYFYHIAAAPGSGEVRRAGLTPPV